MPLSNFDDLESQVDQALKDLQGKIPDVNNEILQTFQDFYFDLEKKSSGNINASVNNLKAIQVFKKKLDKVIQKGVLSQAVGDYLNEFTSSSSIINKYFGQISDEFKDSPTFYKELLTSTVTETADKLLGAGIDANFKQPLIKVLRDNIVSGSNRQQFNQSLKDNIIGAQGQDSPLLKYTNQVASDSITQFNANYIQSISDDLGLNHYYYRGTKIRDTRPFCSKIAGKYFTEDQLKSYVESQMKLNGGKGWAGMVKGENWSNFFTYRGGYACRHYVVPISKEMYLSVPQELRWAA